MGAGAAAAAAVGLGVSDVSILSSRSVRRQMRRPRRVLLLCMLSISGVLSSTDASWSGASRCAEMVIAQ